MITDEEAREAIENIMSSTRVLDTYCNDHDCADCQFHTEEYVCDVVRHLDPRWYK